MTEKAIIKADELSRVIVEWQKEIQILIFCLTQILGVIKKELPETDIGPWQANIKRYNKINNRVRDLSQELKGIISEDITPTQKD